MENTGNIDFFVFGDFSKCYFQEINLKFKQDFFLNMSVLHTVVRIRIHIEFIEIHISYSPFSTF